MPPRSPNLAEGPIEIQQNMPSNEQAVQDERVLPTIEVYIQEPLIHQIDLEAPIPNNLWEPLLNNEELASYWQMLLVEEGDEVEIAGSTVAKFLLGGLPVTEQGVPISSLGADLDVKVADRQLLQRLQTAEVPLAQSGAVYRTNTESGTLVEFIDKEQLRDRLTQSVEQLTDLLTSSSEPYIDTTFFKPVTDAMHSWGAVNESTILQELSQMQQELTSDNWQEAVSKHMPLLPHETLSIKLTRTDSGIEATVNDPLGFATSDRTKKSIEIAQQSSEFFGTAATQLNRDSVYYKYLQTMALKQNIVTEDSLYVETAKEMLLCWEN